MTSSAQRDPPINTSMAAARVFRVLGDPTRLAIVRLLGEQERTVSELVALLQAPQSRISNHLACLRWCRFVDAERKGRQVIYRLTEPRLGRLIEQVEALEQERLDYLVTCKRIGPAWF